MGHTPESEAAIKRYANYMEAVKVRIDAVAKIGSPPIRDMLHGDVQIDSIYLQLRKVLELIAMGSLINNKEEYAKARENFATDWKATRIVPHLKKVNPDFFPQPVVDRDGDLVPTPGALTLEEFEHLYDLSSKVIHTPNPFGEGIKYPEGASQITGWLSKIVTLLNVHKIHLVGDAGFWLIHMRTTTSEKVHYYRFELAPDGQTRMP